MLWVPVNIVNDKLVWRLFLLLFYWSPLVHSVQPWGLSKSLSSTMTISIIIIKSIKSNPTKSHQLEVEPQQVIISNYTILKIFKNKKNPTKSYQLEVQPQRVRARLAPSQQGASGPFRDVTINHHHDISIRKKSGDFQDGIQKKWERKPRLSSS